MATISKRGAYQWQAKIRRRGYPVQSKTFDTKREAEAWASVIESEMARSVFVDRSLSERSTLGEAIETYILSVAPNHKGGDAEIYRLRRFQRIEVDLTCRFMSTLNTSDFQRFCDRRKNEVAAGTVKRELNLLHTVVESVRKEFGLIENPVSDVKRPPVQDERDIRFKKKDVSEDRPSEEEILFKALDACRNPWVKPTVILALETAMRRSELLALRWDNIDLRLRTARLLDTKNGKPRNVPLSPRALDVLKSLPRSMDGRVLATSSEGIKNAFERARKRAGMEHFNFHDLRHEATSRLFERGWNVMEVAAVTGHRDLQSLKRYTNLRAEDLACKFDEEPKVKSNPIYNS